PVVPQNGWTGGACGPPIDEAVVLNATNSNAPSSFEKESLRMSNAVVSGCFNDAFTPQTTNEAGETTAQTSPQSGGTRQPYYAAEFTFASFTGALQPGLNVQVSPDRGDGSRMSFVRMRHTATDLELEFVDVQGVESPNTPPCLGCANFVTTPLGTFDPAVPHTVRLTMQFVDGPGNDIVKVFVDGNLVHTGGSWEDYYTLDTESSPNPPRVSRTVDSLLIRASGNPALDTAGKGFLFDNVSVTTGSVPADEASAGAGEGGAGTSSAAAPVAAVPTFTG
ncbi:MAG TPA: hypothetical protein VKH17_06375, partial [Acidimicrobiia bacterium]|nr:hypothetical protein [Acidimicrobiia bacterium]